EVQEERRVIEDICRRLLSLSFEKHHSKLEECKTRLSEWSRQWSPLVSSLFLPDTTTPDQMAEAVSVLEKVFAHLKEAEGLQYRVKRIGDNIELFEKRASQLIAAVDPSLSS